MSKIQTNENLTKDLLLHIDGIFHQRINIFLVAEGILFATVAASWQSSQNVLTLALCILAIIFTLSLWYTMVRLKVGLDWLVKKYKTLDPSKVYIEYTDLGNSGVSSAYIFTVILPSVTVIFWFFLLFLSLFYK